MEIPSFIKIGGVHNKIEFPYRFKERSDCSGQYLQDQRVIRVTDIDSMGNKLPDSEILITIIHEVIHAIDKASGHRLYDDNENAIEGMSEGIYQVLVDNPHIWRSFLDA